MQTNKYLMSAATQAAAKVDNMSVSEYDIIKESSSKLSQSLISKMKL